MQPRVPFRRGALPHEFCGHVSVCGLNNHEVQIRPSRRRGISNPRPIRTRISPPPSRAWSPSFPWSLVPVAPRHVRLPWGDEPVTACACLLRLRQTGRQADRRREIPQTMTILWHIRPEETTPPHTRGFRPAGRPPPGRAGGTLTHCARTMHSTCKAGGIVVAVGSVFFL